MNRVQNNENIYTENNTQFFVTEWRLPLDVVSIIFFHMETKEFPSAVGVSRIGGWGG